MVDAAGRQSVSDTARGLLGVTVVAVSIMMPTARRYSDILVKPRSMATRCMDTASMPSESAIAMAALTIAGSVSAMRGFLSCWSWRSQIFHASASCQPGLGVSSVYDVSIGH